MFIQMIFFSKYALYICIGLLHGAHMLSPDKKIISRDIKPIPLKRRNQAKINILIRLLDIP